VGTEVMTTIAWIVSLVILTVAVTALSRRVGWSAPIVLVAAGAAASFIPFVPKVVVQPDLILYGVLPPLLFAAAFRTSLVDVRARRDPILLLSVGLVAFTVAVVGAVTWAFVPSLGIAAALAFGAVVAPTDAVAVTAMTRRARMPRALTTLLDGESLLNDATALVALNAAIAAIVSIINPWAIAGDFVLAVVVGVAVGVAVGLTLGEVHRHLASPVLDTSLSFATPYLAFLLATLLHGSGFLAVVIAGILIGYRAPSSSSAASRVAGELNWRIIQFLLENAIFVLVGLSLPDIVAGAFNSGIGLWQTVLICVVVLVTLFASRMMWSIVVTAVYRWGPRRLRRGSWPFNQNIPVSLAGVRGVVTLAAVFLLPAQTPHRAFLQFLAVVVVVGTLLQSLALPWAIRHLTLPRPNLDQERIEAQLLLAEAQVAGLDALEAAETDAVDARVIAQLRTNATFLSESLDITTNDPDAESLHASYVRLRRLTIGAERAAVLKARAEGRYQELAVHAALEIIDAEETALRAAEGEDGGL
jgi:monovalent cation/hydrogen antiporter